MSIFKRVSELTPYEVRTDFGSGAVTELECFADAISKAIRGVKFGVVDGKEHREVHVYTEGQPFTMGYIGYGDWRDNGFEHIDHYNVVSPNITNEKYSYGDPRHRKMSTKLDVALKTAKRFFRNLTPEQMAKNEVIGIRQSAHRVRNKLKEDKDIRYSKILRGNAVLPEFRHMINQGYEFVDQRFGEEVQAYITSIDEYAEAKAKGLNVAFIRVFEKFGEQTFQVVNIGSLEDRPKYSDAIEYTSATLPEDLMGKLSALNMLQKDEYVEDVGFNSGDGLFYVTI
jgi:hypothetical protein|tara:strand:- start:9 stop:860 length:852 start_codon:yes stop_codon:yes gene_type:complete